MQSTRYSTITYRPAIDGLRAIAVCSVLLFHLNEKWLPGGFLGVDIFFVISGYLITAIITEQCNRNEFSISNFYQRRIARIFPAFFLTIFTTLLLASSIYNPQDFAAAGSAATASALSVANLKFLLQGNYFDIGTDAQPFLHFWSLSLEEQFYLILPAGIVLAYTTKRPQKQLTISLSIVLLVSFAACVIATSRNPAWAFYLLPTRAWELICGSLLATIQSGRHAKSITRPTLIACIAVAILALSLVTTSKTEEFPGYLALAPVLATTTILAAPSGKRDQIEALLSWTPAVFVGKLSYSLYLWHWPIYCFTDYALYEENETLRSVLKIATTIAVSFLAWKFAETPLRQLMSRENHKALTFASAILAIGATAAVGVSIRSEYYINCAATQVGNGGLVVNRHIESPVLVLMGDSTASMYGRTLKRIANEYPARLHVISVAGGNPFPGSQQHHDSLKFLKETRPDVVIFSAAWRDKATVNAELMDRTLSDLLRHASHVTLFTQAPILPECGTRSAFRKHGKHLLHENKIEQERREVVNANICDRRSEDVSVIDVTPLLLLSDGQVRLCDAEGRHVYHDRGHLSEAGANLASGLLREAIVAALNRQQPNSPPRKR